MKKSLLLMIGLVAMMCARGAASSVEKEGGYYQLWPSYQGTFLFINIQRDIPEADVKRIIEKMALEFSFDLRYQDTSAVTIPPLKEIAPRMKIMGAKGSMWLINEEGLPLVLSACEDGWAILNIAPLMKDATTPEQRLQRFQREVYRVFGMTNGGYETEMMPQCVMKHTKDVADLDALICSDYSPAAFMKISKYMSLIGYKRCKRGTYYEACEEGWAPMPTNDVQRAIWQKVHSMPTTPLKIEPETTSRVKGRK